MIIENQPENLAQPAGSGCLSELGWHASSFILPAASLSFYRRAAQRSTGNAVLFFVVFMGLITLLSTVGITIKMSQFSDDIRRAFITGGVPEITISNGIAAMKGKQTAILVDKDRVLVAVDTSGSLRDIDPARYTSGLLVTSNELLIYSTNGRSQRISLSELQQMVNQNPLVINGETTARLWQSFTAVFSLVIFFGLALWNLAVRFIYLAFLALVIRTVIGLTGAKIPYGLVLTVGIYAFVPVIYLVYVIDRLERSFFMLQTLLLLVTWGIGLYAVLAKNGWDLLGPDRSLRAWRAVVGLPFLLVLAVDVLFTMKNGGWFGLFAGIITLIALIIAGWLSKPSLDEVGLPDLPAPPPEPPGSGSAAG